MYSDRKQIRDCLQTGSGGGGSKQEGDNHGAGGNGGGGHVHYLAGGESFMGVYMSNSSKFYIFNMCHLLYVNYTSIQMLKQTNHSLNSDGKVI